MPPPWASPSQRRATALSIPTWLTEEMAKHLEAQGLTTNDPEHLVFCAPGGGPLRYNNFRTRIWLPACKAAGLAPLEFRDLRRGAATALVLAGVDVRTAQHRLGHTDPRLTLGIYAQVTSDGDRAAADRLGTHFSTMRPAQVGQTKRTSSTPDVG